MAGEQVRKESINSKRNKGDIINIGFLMKRAEDNVASYRHSKINTSSITNVPNEDECSHQSYMKKVYAIRDLDIAEKRLAAKRIEAKEMTMQLDQKWLQLQEGQRALNENFVKFNEFMKENQEKRERATRKLQDELTLQDERKDMLEKVKNQVNDCQNIQLMMIKMIKNYRLYENYLEDVVKYSTDFKNVTAILDRYHALMEAKLTSCLKHDKGIVELEEARISMAKLIEGKFSVVLRLRSVHAELIPRYEAAHGTVLMWDTILQDVRQRTLDQFIQTKSVILAGKQLHKIMCRRKNISRKNDDFEGRMDFIKRTITQLHWLSYVKFGSGNDKQLAERQLQEQQHDQQQQQQQQMLIKPHVLKTKRNVVINEMHEERKSIAIPCRSRLGVYANLLAENSYVCCTFVLHRNTSITSTYNKRYFHCYCTSSFYTEMWRI